MAVTQEALVAGAMPQVGTGDAFGHLRRPSEGWGPEG
jgi:hypothetical protein